MSALSMMGSRICRDSTFACGTAPWPSRRSSALPFVTTPDNRLRYKRDHSSLCTEGRCRHLMHPRWLQSAVAQRSARLMTTLMRAIECVMDSNSKANREATQSFNPLLRFPEDPNANLHALELGSATGFTKGAIIPQKPPLDDNPERWWDAACSATLHAVTPLCRTCQLLDCIKITA